MHWAALVFQLKKLVSIRHCLKAKGALRGLGSFYKNLGLPIVALKVKILAQEFTNFLFITIVTVHCKDTRIVVNVNTNRPFSGRIYALGRSETCNVDVINSDQFRLDLTMGGQDCNTQSAVRQRLDPWRS